MPTRHEVQQGDYLSKIAAEYGFLWKTLYNHPLNAEFKAKRPDPNVIYPGDVIWIPDKEPGKEDRPTDNRHTFELKGEQAILRVRLLIEDEPIAAAQCKLQVGTQIYNVTTDGDGLLEKNIPGKENSARIEITIPTSMKDYVDLGLTTIEYVLSLGDMDPQNTSEGFEKRLLNLGFYPAEDDVTQEQLRDREAIRQFQKTCNATDTGNSDAVTQDKALTEHGC